MDLSSEELSRVCNRFRVLIIGRRNAGKTTILEKMTGSEAGTKPKIRDKEGRLVDDPTLVKAGLERGMSVIDYEITYPSSPRFVFHDSRGIEAGAESNSHGTEAGERHDSSKLRIEYIQKFIDDRAQRRRTEDQLHAIWFCMPMDTPRVPSDEFELAFLEKVNNNVPVIAVLTKYEALVDRVKAEYKGRQVAKSDILNLLTKKTFEAIKDETLAIIFAMAQQNSMKLACQLTFEQNLAPIFSKLKIATKMDNAAALYEHLINQGLKFLPFWNLIVSCYSHSLFLSYITLIYLCHIYSCFTFSM
ncbi:hypothetical protein V8E52_002799 [Russula decolorans]